MLADPSAQFRWARVSGHLVHDFAALEDDLARRRRVNRHIPDRAIVQYLFEEIGPRYSTRPGGYTRIIRLPNRQGDNAPVARLELVND